MYYNNILMDDKTAVCVGGLCFGELDCSVVSVLWWLCSCSPFHLWSGQWKENGLP